MAVADHQRAVAERNGEAILDGVEALLERGESLSMSAIATAAGISRPTLYAHHGTLPEIVEAVVTRAIGASAAAFATGDPQSGTPPEALDRMLAVTWTALARFRAIAVAAHEHLAPAAVVRSHAAVIAPLEQLVARGRLDGAFRTDVPADWLISTYFALAHAADDHARTHGAPREDVLAWLRTTARDAFGASGPDQ